MVSTSIFGQIIGVRIP